MKKIVIWLFFFTGITTPLLPQEYVSLFHNDLSERILLEAYPMKIADNDLESAAVIHPELFYYFITYYNVKYDGVVEPEYRINEDILRDLKSSYLKARNDWFRQVEEHLTAIEEDSFRIVGEVNYLYKSNPYKGFIITKNCDSCYRTDKNKRDYFIYKYLSKDTSLTYKTDINYASFRHDYEIKEKKKLEESLKRMNDSSLTQESAEDIYDNLITHWYLFPEATGTDSALALYTKLIYTDYYKGDHLVENKNIRRSPKTFSGVPNKNRKSVGLKMLLNYNMVTLPSIRYLYLSSHANVPQLAGTYDITASQIFAGASFSINFTRSNGPFSKLIMEAGFGISHPGKSIPLYYPGELPPIGHNEEQADWISDKMTPDKNYINIRGINDISFKVKTPILYIGDEFSLGLGGILQKVTISTITNTDFYFKKVLRRIGYMGQITTIPEAYIQEVRNGEEGTTSLTKIYPIITAEYGLPWNFNINLEVTQNYYVAGISYSIL